MGCVFSMQNCSYHVTFYMNIHVNLQIAAIPETNMASVVGSEVEIQDVGDVQIEEVEVEPVPVEMPIETVETSGETVEIQPMIALQPLPEAGEEVILQTTEEIVGDTTNLVYVDSMTIPVPTPEIEISTEEQSPSTSKRGKGGKKRGKTKGILVDGDSELTFDPNSTTRRWEQKQVQIKTLEGEFSVTMWASGRVNSSVTCRNNLIT